MEAGHTTVIQDQHAMVTGPHIGLARQDATVNPGKAANTGSGPGIRTGTDVAVRSPHSILPCGSLPACRHVSTSWDTLRGHPTAFFPAKPPVRFPDSRGITARRLPAPSPPMWSDLWESRSGFINPRSSRCKRDARHGKERARRISPWIFNERRTPPGGASRCSPSGYAHFAPCQRWNALKYPWGYIRVVPPWQMAKMGSNAAPGIYETASKN